MIDHISVVIVTKNEEHNIAACLESLSDFSDIWVVDSHSLDQTAEIVQTYQDVHCVQFEWNGHYPKKRQWCLDTLNLRDWVFFIDADERMTPVLFEEIKSLNPYTLSGYYIKGQYVINGQPLKHGMQNHKLCLINRHMMHFPVVNDLDISGIGEIEGHYQPVLKSQGKTGTLKNPILHHAYHNWQERHQCYAHWQAVMNRRGANLNDTRTLKKLWAYVPFKPFIAFIHSYGFKGGFLDGRKGFHHAYKRGQYYAMIAHASKELEQNGEVSTHTLAPNR